MIRRPFGLTVALYWVVQSSPAWAATLKVGPSEQYKQISDAWAQANPGDVIEVMGGQTYSGTINFTPDRGGTATQPITVRGIPVDGKRPILKGVGPGRWDTMTVLLNANHFVMESFEVIGSSDSDDCVVHKADDVTLRDFVIHECRSIGGLWSTDSESGSLTVEYSEFYHNGKGEYSHQLYPATDQDMYPHSTFRMAHCYLHDSTGGNGVQSRAERNEIYYNWIEGAMYHELDLVGPDSSDPTKPTRQCNSDVVGNVLIKASEYLIARIGGDGTGNSKGRYRFVNNTMVLANVSTSVIGLQETVETLEMYNNVIFAPKSGVRIYEINEPSGPAATFFGSNNWMVTGTTNAPSAWKATLTGADPSFVDFTNHDLRPTTSSPLVGQGTTATIATSSLAFPAPLGFPAYYPPHRRLLPLGAAEARPASDTPSIGAFEPTASVPGAPPPDVGAGGSGGGTTTASSSGCNCTTGTQNPDAGSLLAGLSMLALGLARRARAARVKPGSASSQG